MSAICDAHKKKVDVELLCNSVHRKFNQLETRCGIESQHLAEGALRPPIEQLGSDELEIRCGRENQHPENRKETLMGIRVGVNMLQFCSVSNSLLHTTLSNKVKGIFF